MQHTISKAIVQPCKQKFRTNRFIGILGTLRRSVVYRSLAVGKKAPRISVSTISRKCRTQPPAFCVVAMQENMDIAQPGNEVRLE